jgi:predicted nicotinamide N-methyase
MTSRPRCHIAITLALSMLDRHDGLSRKSLLAFADATGVPAPAAERTLAECWQQPSRSPMSSRRARCRSQSRSSRLGFGA